MKSFTHDGIRIAYHEEGVPDGPAVVFSHGFLMDHEMFSPNVAALRDTFRCITWDQRGFGETGAVANAFSYWDSARDLIALLNHLEVTSASLVGMSQGGFISMRAALLAPERFRAIALISTRSAPDDEQVKASFERLKEEWASGGAANVAWPLSRLLLGEGYDAADWVAKWHRIGIPHFEHPVDALVHRDDITSRLPEITLDAIVFHGGADIAIDPAFGKALAQGLPACRDFICVDGAGHTPNLTHPDAVNPALRDFLTRYGWG
ncbi:alpha/beta fold hydrolase [Paraburkholderia sp. D1E]|uniref:alpha/beta fold hydrolase n=1 Tax=Paraburkholderia sp. D1E TaxID=3461398 RepID=UPI0040452A19